MGSKSRAVRKISEVSTMRSALLALLVLLSGRVECAFAKSGGMALRARPFRTTAPIAVERGIGEGRSLPAPSRVNTWPEPTQAVVVLAISLAIGAGTALLVGPLFDALRGTAPFAWWQSSWPLLGVIYLTAGVAHFTELEGFENITPPNGTWGFWWTPFSPRVNVLWTGVVEIFGGLWMLLGYGAPLLGVRLPASFGPVTSDAALTLFLLTVAVTPANIYALTHGANFPLNVETPPAAHAVRLALQSVLLAIFWELAQPTLLDAKINLGLI